MHTEKIWQEYKDRYQDKGYTLVDVQETYFPIWKCTQELISCSQIPLDGFSRVILQTIEAGKVAHKEICAFLGLDQERFVLGQFHYLLQQDFVRLAEDQTYWITPQGKELLKEQAKVEQLDSIKFEYYIIQGQASSRKEKMALQFFNPKQPLNTDLSTAKQANFEGYRVYQSNRLERSSSVQILPHDQNQAPNLSKLRSQKNKLADFFTKVTGKQWYSFGTGGVKCYPHHLCFLKLLYQKEGDKRASVIDVRQSPKSVWRFEGFELETFFYS